MEKKIKMLEKKKMIKEKKMMKNIIKIAPEPLFGFFRKIFFSR